MSTDPTLDRYSRQMRFYGIAEAGQRKLLDSHVTLCGVGALGTVLANALVRGGVGHVRIVDRDFIETSNLQRQVLFDEHDVAEEPPKAEAAARKLGAINSSVHVEPIDASEVSTHGTANERGVSMIVADSMPPPAEVALLRSVIRRGSLASSSPG